MTATTIEVQTERDPYSIIIGNDSLLELERWLSPLLLRKKIAVIADEQALAAEGEKLRGLLKQAQFDATIISAGAGEEAKSFETLEKICTELLESHIERDDFILSFGGGAIGDLTGLAANLVRRGVRCGHIPTTLLAQTDSAIGGKTAINSPHGKNLLGTFYPPALVVIDPTLTRNLPQREFLAGYAEIVKYAIIGDSDFFSWLEEKGDKVIKKDKEALLYAIEKSCYAKADIVSKDEKEQGQRALLNFGHTFGHALEALSRYELRHGEAVAIGMVLAAKLSAQLGFMPASDAQRIANHLDSVGLPTDSPLLDEPEGKEKMLHWMEQDKKNKQGKLVLVLAEAIGKAWTYDKCSPDDLMTLFNTRHKDGELTA